MDYLSFIIGGILLVVSFWAIILVTFHKFKPFINYFLVGVSFLMTVIAGILIYKAI